MSGGRDDKVVSTGCRCAADVRGLGPLGSLKESERNPLPRLNRHNVHVPDSLWITARLLVRHYPHFLKSRRL